MRIPAPSAGRATSASSPTRARELSRPPGPEADWSEAWDDYLHNRDNPAGDVRELWQHTGGCGAWLVVTRDTVTHEVLEVSSHGRPSMRA
jgi:heterotetrameric sarcosine oxidase delta subunit